MTVLLVCLAVPIALLCAGRLFEVRGERADARRFAPPGRMVDIGTHRLHMLYCGPERGPTVVVEQGAGGPSLLWSTVVGRIAEFTGVCAYDRAGIGPSDPAPRSRTPAESADELHALLERAGIPGPYVLVAHSYGGLIARLFARDHRNEVAGLVLVDTIEEGAHFRPDVLPVYRRFSVLLGAMALAARFGVLRLIGTLRPGAAEEAPLAALGQSPAFFRAMRADFKTLDRYAPALRVSGATGDLDDLPLIVITHGQPFPGAFGKVEKYWRDGQERLAALSTRGELIVAERSNHMIQIDEPDVVVAAIGRVFQAAQSAAALTCRH